ncbi:hypothetical protein [Planctomycetes bacterium K23_9]|uniref:Uncharacterized protein n=1 Tax=Stieleria marina TaxID=1930275 RepID=A0A517NQT2_9BACT|nr:hypothetical protein K239x_14300 [Planctomycetes bacterium K23_9]
MRNQIQSRRRLRLERLEGRALMSADAFGWMGDQPLNYDRAFESAARQVDQTRGRTDSQQLQSRQFRGLENASRLSPNDTAVDSQRADRVFREGVSLHQERPSHGQPLSHPSRSQNHQPTNSVLVVYVFTPVSQARSIGSENTFGVSGLAPTNNAIVVSSSGPNSNEILSLGSGGLTGSTLQSSPQGEFVAPNSERDEVQRDGQPPSDGPLSTEGRLSTESPERQAVASDLSIDTSSETASALSRISATNEVVLVSLTQSDWGKFSFETGALTTEGLGGDSLDAASQTNRGSGFLRRIDEAIRQSGIDSWLDQSEATEFGLADLDDLIEQLSQADSAQPGGAARSVGGEIYDRVTSSSNNAWLNSISEMIRIEPNAGLSASSGIELDAESDEVPRPWAAGIGMYRAFDFAGMQTQFGDAVANVSVPIDSGAWNLTGDWTDTRELSPGLIETPIVSLNTSIAVGLAVGVLGIQYFRGRLRGQHDQHSYITHVGSGRSGGQ